MQKLGIGEGIVRIDRSDCDFNLTVPLPEVEDEADKRREEAKAASRATYGTPRSEVEAMLRAAWESGVADAEATKKETVPKKSTLRKSASDVSPPAPPETPKPVDVPKVTDSEKDKVVVAEVKPVVVESSKPSVIREPQTPRDQGKGGEQHKAIQRRIKDAAEALGFRSVIEKQLANSAQSIDLFLERGDQQIACEISISTTIDHEVGNVRKCLEAGIP